jgi:hypothetical protein
VNLNLKNNPFVAAVRGHENALRWFEENHDEWVDRLKAGQPVSSYGAQQLGEHVETLYTLWKLARRRLDLITKLNMLFGIAQLITLALWWFS